MNREHWDGKVENMPASIRINLQNLKEVSWKRGFWAGFLTGFGSWVLGRILASMLGQV